MNNFHYNQDPLYAAAASVMRGETLDNTLDEAIDLSIVNSLNTKDIIDIYTTFLIIGGATTISGLIILYSRLPAAVAFKMLTGSIKKYFSDKANEKNAKLKTVADAQLLKDTLNKILKDNKSKEFISQIKNYAVASNSIENGKRNNEERKKLARAYIAHLKNLLNDEEYSLIDDIYNKTIRESVETIDESATISFNQDPLYAAAAKILSGTTLTEDASHASALKELKASKGAEMIKSKNNHVFGKNGGFSAAQEDSDTIAIMIFKQSNKGWITKTTFYTIEKEDGESYFNVYSQDVTHIANPKTSAEKVYEIAKQHSDSKYYFKSFNPKLEIDELN